MMRAIVDRARLNDISERVRAVAASPYMISTAWLEAKDYLALAEESGRHFDEEQAERFVNAAATIGFDRFVGVAHDGLFVTPSVTAVEVSADLDGVLAFTREFSGVNALLIPVDKLDFAVLCTVDDFHIVAGPFSFLSRYVPDLLKCRAEFTEFVNSQTPVLRPAAEEAGLLMSWSEVGCRGPVVEYGWAWGDTRVYV